MRRSWLALLAAAGCDKVLSLNDVGIDPNETTVFVHGVTRTVINDSSHLPTTRDTDYSSMTTIKAVVAVLDDGTSPPIQLDPTHGPGSFFFNRHDHLEPYRLIVPPTTADAAPVEYQLSMGTLDLLERSWGRSSLPIPPAQQQPTGGTRLQYMLTTGTPPTPSAKAYAAIESTGLWTDTIVATGAQSTMPPALDWVNANSLFGPVYDLNGSPSIRDRAYYTLHDYAGTPYAFILGYRFDDVQMTAGMTVTAAGPYYALPRDTCVHVDAELQKASDAVMKAGLGTPAAIWKIEAVPIADMGPDVHFTVVEGNGSPVDATFGVPFAGYSLVLAMEAMVPHPIMAPGAAVSDVRADGSTHWTPASATSATSSGLCPSPITLMANVPVPTALLLDGGSISSDRTVQVDRTRPALLSWTPNGTTQAQLYRADLYEVSNDAGKTFLHHVVRFITTNASPEGNPTVGIDPSYLSLGGTYVLEVSDLLGFSSAANGGDFTTIDDTYSQGTAWSGLLSVTK